MLKRIGSMIAFVVALAGLLVGGAWLFSIWGSFATATPGEWATVAIGFSVFGVGVIAAYVLRKMA